MSDSFNGITEVEDDARIPLNRVVLRVEILCSKPIDIDYTVLGDMIWSLTPIDTEDGDVLVSETSRSYHI